MVKAVRVEVQTDAEPVITRLAEAVSHLEAGSVYVGIRATKGSDLVMRAVANEFGTSRIPERSFLRATMDRKRDEYAQILQDAVDRGLQGEEMRAELERVGQLAVGDVRATIARGVPPPNAPSTIRRKGSSKPLIDTGRMWQSLDAVVQLGDYEAGAAPAEEREAKRGARLTRAGLGIGATVAAGVGLRLLTRGRR